MGRERTVCRSGRIVSLGLALPSQRDWKVTAMTCDARGYASQRLEAAHVERDRLEARFRAAIGTSSEFGAYSRLRRGRAAVAAQHARLDQLDGNGSNHDG